MQKDRYVAHKLTKEGLVIQGSRCEMALTFEALAAILRELSNALPGEPQESAVAAGWSGSRSAELLMDPIQHPKWTGRPGRK